MEQPSNRAWAHSSQYYKGLLLLCAAIAGCLVLYRYDPRQSSFYPPCIFKKLTGLDCPGCGSTRALYSLLHGHLLQSADQNLLLLPALLLIISGTYHMVTGKGERLWNSLNRPRWVLAVICLFWVLRNIPLAPFMWLHSGL